MPSEHILRRPGAALRAVEAGSGPMVMFQHGLGGDAAQVAEVFPDGPWRRLTLECRAHGASDTGPVDALRIATFAEDVWALAESDAVVGGISMGAAIALRLAVLHPARVRALILVRPAWLFAAAPDTMRAFADAAELLKHYPPAEARARFADSALARHLRDAAPDNLASLLGFFDRADPATTAELLGRIAADGPGVSGAEASALRLPALVIGCARDHVHPLAFAETLAATIPGARLVEVAPKASDRAAHAREVRAAIAAFLSALPRSLP